MPQSVLIGLVVFAANAGLLVLQLLAGKFLAPFVGSSLETWAAVIGVFLAGIAGGNAVGGKLADRFPSPRVLVFVLLAGAAAAAWMVGAYSILESHPWHRALPLGPRIPVLAFVLGFPAGFALSVVTPVAIRVGLPDASQAGRVAGRVFALGTLGCLAGNYVTGFYLLAAFPIDSLALGVAGAFVVLAGLSGVSWTGPRSGVAARPNEISRSPMMSFSRASAVVFLCSFAAMALELAAVRMLAQVFGVSVFTWTGAIGVMLGGTAAGNWVGGRYADGPDRLARTLIATAAAAVAVVVLFIVASRTDFLHAWDLQARIVGWSFLVYFLPMALLGAVSPQVIRLLVPDVAHAGRVAGRVYAWSTGGAIAGVLVTGFWLFGLLGMTRVVLAAALFPAAAVFLVVPAWTRIALLYPLCVVGGAAVAGLLTFTPDVTHVTKETNYYAIHVKPAKDDLGEVVPNQFTLQLDSLVHSRVDVTDPTFLHYKHENVQMELLRLIRERVPAPRVLVIGGGGYTFPRCAKTVIPACSMDVVEIDPGVTEVSYAHLGLDRRLGIVSHHMDGRQFLSERADEAVYDLITLDAVNDLSVPAHLLTVEFDRELKRCLAPHGVYLVSVIDTPAYGTLWKAVRRTLSREFPHVEVLTGDPVWDPGKQTVFVFYASFEPFDAKAVKRVAGAGAHTWRPPVEMTSTADAPVLTDRFAPVDQMMIEVYRRRIFER